MIAVDTNILVYAHRGDSSFHKKADKVLTELAESGNVWAIAWPCIHEFFAIVTHPKIYSPASPIDYAIKQIDYWLECPTLHMIGELSGYWDFLKKTLIAGKITGPKVHDARIATICQQNNVKLLLTADRDFSRMGNIKTKNPLV